MEPRRGSSSFLLPITDNGEKSRLDFWRQHAEAIPADLLRITGWLDQAPDRTVFVQDGTRVERATARERPPNVLFRVPPRGSAEHRRWQDILFYLRIEKAKRESVTAHLRQAEAALKAARATQETLWAELYEVDETSRDAGRRAREDVTPAARTRALQELRSGTEAARAAASRFRIARKHTLQAQRNLDYWRRNTEPTVYPGLFASVNSFLDMQALGVANIASDEFKKRPHRGPSASGAPEELPELVADGR